MPRDLLLVASEAQARLLDPTLSDEARLKAWEELHAAMAELALSPSVPAVDREFATQWLASLRQHLEIDTPALLQSLSELAGSAGDPAIQAEAQ